MISQLPDSTDARRRPWRGALALLLTTVALTLAGCTTPSTGAGGHAGGEANLTLPPFEGSNRTLLLIGLAITIGGFAFGLFSYVQLKKLPVHASMREIIGSSLRVTKL